MDSTMNAVAMGLTSQVATLLCEKAEKNQEEKAALSQLFVKCKAHELALYAFLKEMYGFSIGELATKEAFNKLKDYVTFLQEEERFSENQARGYYQACFDERARPLVGNPDFYIWLVWRLSLGLVWGFDLYKPWYVFYHSLAAAGAHYRHKNSGYPFSEKEAAQKVLRMLEVAMQEYADQ